MKEKKKKVEEKKMCGKEFNVKRKLMIWGERLRVEGKDIEDEENFAVSRDSNMYERRWEKQSRGKRENEKHFYKRVMRKEDAEDGVRGDELNICTFENRQQDDFILTESTASSLSTI